MWCQKRRRRRRRKRRRDVEKREGRKQDGMKTQRRYLKDDDDDATSSSSSSSFFLCPNVNPMRRRRRDRVRERDDAACSLCCFGPLSSFGRPKKLAPFLVDRKEDASPKRTLSPSLFLYFTRESRRTNQEKGEKAEARRQ
jgi:hypothetical protein